jgi:hypothetical protein
MTPRATSRSIRLGFATRSVDSVIGNLWVLTCAISLVLLGSSPCWAQRKADAVLEFIPAPASARMAGDAKLHTVVAARRDGGAKLFSATARGLQVSEDAGRSWERLPVAGRETRIFALETHPTVPGKLYVGSSDGLWMSTDSGRSWDPLPYPGSVPLALAAAPSEPNTLYLSTARQGIHKSKNGGRSWEEINGGLPVSHSGNRPEQVDQVWIDPDNANKVLASAERLGVFRTTNGQVWDEFNRGLPYPLSRPVSSAKFARDPSGTSDNLYLAMLQPIHSHLVRTRLFVLDEQEAWRPLRARIPENFSVKSLIIDTVRQKLQLWGDQKVLEAPLPR